MKEILLIAVVKQNISRNYKQLTAHLKARVMYHRYSVLSTVKQL